MRDEELATTSIFPVERHPDRATEIGMLVEFVSYGIAWSSLAVAARVSALDDEVWHDAVEQQPVVETAPG